MKIKKNGKVINLTEKEIKKLIKIKEQGPGTKVIKQLPKPAQDLGKIADEIKKAYGEGCNKVGRSTCNDESQEAWEKLVTYNVKDPRNYPFNKGVIHFKDWMGVDMTISAELLKAISQYNITP